MRPHSATSDREPYDRLPAVVRDAFERLVSACGAHRATAFDDLEGWRLYHNPVTHLFGIEIVDTKGGGIRQPFGVRLYSAEGFIALANFAIDAIHQHRINRKEVS